MATQTDLQGKRALVTGAARGIGLAIASKLQDAGAHLVMTDIDEPLLAEAASALGHSARPAVHAVLDVRDADAFAATVASFEETVGPIDILINNAGIMAIGEFLEQPQANDVRQVDINLHGVINGTRAVLPFMTQRNSGAIVNIASVAGIVGTPNAAVYSATKFAVVGFTQALHMEYSHTGISFSYICPSLVQTELITGSKEPRWPKPVTVDDVAQSALHAIRSGKLEHFVPKAGRLSAVLPPLLPRSLTRTIGHMLGLTNVFYGVDDTKRSSYRDRIRSV